MENNHIIIGLGGSGGNIIRSFRKRIFQDFSEEEIRNLPIGYVFIDSSIEMMDPNDPSWKLLGKNTQLGRDSQLFIRGANLKDQLDNVENYPGVKNWIGDRRIWDNIVGAVADDGAAAQRRRLGRFLFSCKSGEYLTILQNQVVAVRAKTNQVDVTFHVFAGLAGGTGSGSIIDAVAQIRKRYQPNVGAGLKYKIFVYCLVPEQTPKPGWDKGFYHANGFAALQELSALSVESFKPHDVTGELDRIGIDGNGDSFNGCYLFTNANENGIIVDTKTELPNIVSDFLCQKIFLTNGSSAKTEFDRTENFENISDWKEFDEITKKPIRSMRFLSFGIKRIVIPEQEIIEYFTYNFSKQALLQFKYNNWSDDLGFRDERRNEDYHTYVNDKNTIRKWMLSDDHLTLSYPILKSDTTQNWKTIIEDWNGIISQLKEIAWQKSETTALNDLAKYCEERFDKNFRRTGVRDFYSIKRKAKRDIAQEICQKIERDLFDEWKNGQKSVNDIAKIIDILTDITRTRLGAFDNKLNTISEEIEKQIVAKKKNEIKWSDTNWLKTVFGAKKNLFEGQGVVLQTLYTQKTNFEAMAFAKELLAEVLTHIELLSAQITLFADKLNNAIENIQKLIASRCQDRGITAETYKEAVVRYYDAGNVKQFTSRLLKDETIQKRQASAVRNELVEKVGNEPTFTKLLERISDETLMDAIESNGETQSIAAHNDLINIKRDKLIGVNIIEKLYEQFGVDQNGLNDFVRNIVKYSGTYLNFNDSEITKKIDNNNAPRPGVNIKVENIIVSIPQVEDKRDFVDKLKLAFRNSISGSKTLIFDEESTKLNEISIMSMTYCFPLRAVNELTFLKQKYDLTLSQNDKEMAQLVLHLEGDGTQYPKLFLKSTSEKRAEVEEKNMFFTTLAYYLLGTALESIKLMDLENGTGKMHYGMNQTDKYGRELSPIFFGAKITSAHGKIDPVTFEKIKNEVDSKLKGEFLNESKRMDLLKKMTLTLNDTIKSECNGNKSDPVYKDFFTSSDVAINLLEIEN